MTSDKFSEIAILLQQKLPEWNRTEIVDFVKVMVKHEDDLSVINSRLMTTLNTDDLRQRELIRRRVRETIYNNNLGGVFPYTFHTEPADAAIRFEVGQGYSNHKDGKSLTFKIR